jgi:hypothetical protein
MHTKSSIEVTVNGKVRDRVAIKCEATGATFTITHDGQRCPCGQMFNLWGQRITHRGY